MQRKLLDLQHDESIRIVNETRKKAEQERQALKDASASASELMEAKFAIRLCTDKVRKSDKAERPVRLTRDMDKRRTRAERSPAHTENRENSRRKQKEFSEAWQEQQPPEFDQATAQREKGEVDKLPVDFDESDSISSVNYCQDYSTNSNNDNHDQTHHNAMASQETETETYVTKTFVERNFEINLNKLKQSHVLNLSNVTLSPTELVLLGMGLTFIPMPSPPDLGEINNNLAYMFPRMRLKLHFADDDTETESSEFEQHLNIMFRNKSKWTLAPNADVFLDAFIEAVKNDFHKLKLPSPYKNLPKKFLPRSPKLLFI